MTRKLFLRLCLAMAVVLSTYSCRQDLLPEKDTYNNSGAFQLTSKRISLEESKHRGKVVSKLEQVENKLKTFSHTDALGKIVNYGNGVSIDTESVIYIENGPNYHTYTFHINKANAPANAPVENLVLTPLPDGTYKELLVTYNLTPAEKLQAENGVAINTHGKAQITELAKGTFNNGNLQGKEITGITCGWTEEVQFTTCSDKVHSNGELPDEMGGDCEATITSQFYTVAVYKCDWIYSEGNPFNAGGPGETINQPPGAPGAGAPISGTCPDNGVLIAPIDPTSGTNMECESGVPTQLTVPVKPQTPCAKIKAQREDEGFSKRIDTLQGKTGLTKETGYIQKWGGDYEYKDNAGATSTANTLKLPEVISNTWIKAYSHTHVDDIPNSYKKGIKMFSPADASYLMDLVQNAQTNGHSLSDPYGVMVTSIGNYQLRFTGNKFQIKTFTEQEKENHREPFVRAMEKFMDTPKKLEFRFLKYIQEKMLLYGITLYRMNGDGTTTEIKLNADKTDTTENTCP